MLETNLQVLVGSRVQQQLNWIVITNFVIVTIEMQIVTNPLDLNYRVT